MKKIILLIAIVALAASCNKAGNTEDKNMMERVSYVVGYNMGKQMAKDSLDIDVDSYLLGLRQAIKGDSSRFSAAETDSIMRQFQEFLGKRAKEKASREIEANSKDGNAFLESNKTKPNVKTTASGLQIEVLAEGGNTAPKETDVVNLNIKMMDIKGTVLFDSQQAGGPQPFKMNAQQFPAIDEAIKTMKLGQKVKLAVPPALAFGENGNPQLKIGPGQVLVMEVEMISVVDPAAAKK